MSVFISTIYTTWFRFYVYVEHLLVGGGVGGGGGVEGVFVNLYNILILS